MAVLLDDKGASDNFKDLCSSSTWASVQTPLSSYEAVKCDANAVSCINCDTGMPLYGGKYSARLTHTAVHYQKLLN
jgi:hypothetical protein